MSIEFARVTLTTAGQNARTVTAQLRLTGSEGADDDAEPADGSEIVQPLGVISRPAITPHTEAAYVRMGDEIVVLALLDKSAATMTDLQEGELRLYAPGSDDAKIQLLPNGTIVLRAGTKNVAREEDSLNVGALSATAGPYPVTFSYTPGGYPSPGAPQAGPSVNLAGIISHGTGNPNVKA